HGEKDAAGAYYLLPADYQSGGGNPLPKRAVPMKLILDTLADLHCPVVLVLDTCFSGALLNQGGAVRQQLAKRDAPTLVLTAARERAWQSGENGVLTAALIQALNETPRATL